MHVRTAASISLTLFIVVTALVSALASGGQVAAAPVPSLLAPTVWTAESDQAGAAFGAWVASAGDVNGDGFDDVIVGAPRSSGGRAFLYLGSASGPAITPAWVAGEGGRFGASVASAGDVNGDGFADVIVGAPDYIVSIDPPFGNTYFGGAAFIYFGSPAGLPSRPSQLIYLIPGGSGYQFGSQVAPAGDVNGDGYGDVVIVRAAQGCCDDHAYVFLGSATGLGASPAWIGPPPGGDVTFEGLRAAGAGDFNGDGYSDVILGAPHYGIPFPGRIWLILGSASGLSALDRWRASGDPDTNLGLWVAGAGDVNHDGFDDVLASDATGRLFVYLGSASGLPLGPPATLTGDQPGSGFGLVAAGAGDANRDGFDDVIVGAENYDNGETDEGAAFLFLGSPAGLQTPAARSAEGDQARARFGSSVGSAGDVDGDGYADLIVGAPLYDNDQIDEGRAFVYRSGLPVEPCTDADDDGFGSPGSPGCPAGGRTDCNDADPAINPGAQEVCDGRDNNCDGQVDECDDGDQCTLDICDPVAGCIHPVDPALPDTDHDGLPDECDGCPTAYNPGQEDCNGNGVQDACDPFAVPLSAQALKGNVLVTWSTYCEVDLSGFNVVVVYAKKQRRVIVGRVPCAECTTGAGHDYSFDIRKNRPGPNDSIYLEVLHRSGLVQTFGPVSPIPPP